MTTGKRTTSYRADEIILKMCKHLSKRKMGRDTPSGIARGIGINPKTAQKYVEIGKNLGIFKTNIFESNNMLVVWINEKYKPILEDMRSGKTYTLGS